MIAIHSRNALAVLVERGLSPYDAIEALARLRPVARYDGAAYYSPKAVYAVRALSKRG